MLKRGVVRSAKPMGFQESGGRGAFRTPDPYHVKVVDTIACERGQ